MSHTIQSGTRTVPHKVQMWMLTLLPHSGKMQTEQIEPKGLKLTHGHAFCIQILRTTATLHAVLCQLFHKSASAKPKGFPSGYLWDVQNLLAWRLWNKLKISIHPNIFGPRILLKSTTASTFENLSCGFSVKKEEIHHDPWGHLWVLRCLSGLSPYWKSIG